MEQYIVKVVIETLTGTIVGEETFNTGAIAEIKAFGGCSPIDNFVKETIENIVDERRSNPHHHKNRLD